MTGEVLINFCKNYCTQVQPEKVVVFSILDEGPTEPDNGCYCLFSYDDLPSPWNATLRDQYDPPA